MTKNAALILSSLLLAACAKQPLPSADFPTSDWQTQEVTDQRYLLWPGDTVEVTVLTAPELSRTVPIGPDGRIRVPLSGPVLAAGRTVDEVRVGMIMALSSQLQDPDIELIVTEFGSQQVFVGGEVNQPGLFPLPGQIGPLQAILLAGGQNENADLKRVLILRRLPGGEMKQAVVNIKDGIYDPTLAEWGPLQRFDTVVVLPTWIAQENRFMQQYVRQALPVEFGLFFDLATIG
ncbi:MAG: polysaccharide biosynthesis/export family protein [Pseudomonadota bacterium]